ncbi:MAG TPA: histidine phosphatase family protein [Alphaproteobacteria bacterium]|nr:histidine phosphatase family protein [Alphaproteobacteria bacterium]
MKDLFLLRHAKSSWADPGMEDAARPLNKRGRKGAAAIGTWMEEEGLRPSLVLCSSARRTRETLELLHGALGARVPIQIEPGLYLADTASLLARLRHIPREVPSALVIAHNPGLQELVAELAAAPGAASTGTRARLHRKFPTAALARFRLKLDDWGSLSPDAPAGTIKLLKVISPAQLGVGKDS